MSNRILAFLSLLSRQILNSLANNFWETVWEEIFKLIITAEEKWSESGRGEEKKEWVLAEAMSYINQEHELNWIKRRIIEFFLCKVIDSLIKTFNDLVGQDWIEVVKSLEQNWWEEIINTQQNESF